MGGLEIGKSEQKRWAGTKPHGAIMANNPRVEQGVVMIQVKGLDSGKGKRVKSTTIGPNLIHKEQGEP